MSQNKYKLSKVRDSLLEQMLDLLWRQWCTLGVQGHAAKPDNKVIDPEALMLATCLFGRYEIRLFDQMLDWLSINHSSINLNRMKSSLKWLPDELKRSLGAVCLTFANNNRSSKWLSLADACKPLSKPEEQKIFFPAVTVKPNPDLLDPSFLRYGFLRNVYESRGLTGFCDYMTPATLRIRLRHFFGVNARAEIIAYLTCLKDGDNPTSMSKRIHYSQKNLNDTLSDMARSDYLQYYNDGYRCIYMLSNNTYDFFLKGVQKAPQWFDWMNVFGFVIFLWPKLNDSGFQRMSERSQSVELRIMLEEMPKEFSAWIINSYNYHSISSDGHILHTIVDYTENFIKEINI